LELKGGHAASDMGSLWRREGLTFGELLRRVWGQILKNDVLGQAAELAFFFLLALFPLLILLINIFGYFAQSENLRSSLLEYFQRALPQPAFFLVRNTLDQITKGASGGKLSIGIIGTLWAASSGISALSDGLNRAYGIQDRRPWWKARLIAVGLTFLFTIFTVLSLLLILLGGEIGVLLAGRMGVERAFLWFWAVARWTLAFFFLLTVVHLLYRFAPDIPEWKWRWMTPGALVAVGVWMGTSLGFRIYLRYFNSFNATYGSLGAVVILMLWFYLTAIAILAGAEIDSQIEKANATQTQDERLPRPS
jgi:membrane protein